MSVNQKGSHHKLEGKQRRQKEKHTKLRNIVFGLNLILVASNTTYFTIIHVCTKYWIKDSSDPPPLFCDWHPAILQSYKLLRKVFRSLGFRWQLSACREIFEIYVLTSPILFHNKILKLMLSCFFVCKVFLCVNYVYQKFSIETIFQIWRLAVAYLKLKRFLWNRSRKVLRIF